MNYRIFKYLFLMFLRGSTILVKFGLNLYVTRFIGLTELGIYGLIVAISLALPVLLRLGVFNSIARDLVDAEDLHIATDLKHYLYWVGFCYGLILLFLPAIGLIPSLLELRNYAYLVWAIILGEHIAVDVVFLLNNLRRPQAANLYSLGQAAVWALPFMALSWFLPGYRTLSFLLLSWALGTFISLVGASLLFKYLPWAQARVTNLQWFFDRFRASGYLLVSEQVGNINQFMDRFFIAYFINLEQAGVYTLFFQIANSLFTLLSSSIVQLYRPKIISAFRKNNEGEAKSHLRLLWLEAQGIFLVLALIVAVGFHYFAPLLRRPAVLLYFPLLWAVLAALWFKLACAICNFDIYARRKDIECAECSIITFVVITTLSFITFRVLGVYSIPFALTSGYGIVIWLVLKRHRSLS